MATAMYFSFVILCALVIAPSNAQTAIPQAIIDFINGMTQGNNNQALVPNPSSSSPQLSLVESFGPISSSTLNGGTQQNSGGSSSGSSQASSQSSSASGAKVAQFFGNGFAGTSSSSNSGGGSGGFGGGGMGGNSVTTSTTTGSGSLPGSQVLGNDILSKVAAFVNQAYTGPSGNTANQASGFDTSAGTGSGTPLPMNLGMSQMGGAPSLSSGFGGMPMNGGVDPMGGMMSMTPVDPLAGMPPSMLSPLRSQAMLRVGRQLGQRFGMKQYYEMHGCEDPIQLFSGRQRIMATLAMAQGCHSMQAVQVCRMAQFKERIGNSLLTSTVLPPQVRTRLEGCLSAKVLFNSLSQSSSMLGMMPMGTGAPSLRECGVLLTSVMQEGALDPETMITTRRSMLPWSCNESTMGANGIPYRVCCPGKVHEPTLTEAHIVRRMINA